MMKIQDINVTETINQARVMLKDPQKVSPEFAAIFLLILTLLEILLGRVSKNSKNSSIPPSQDPHRQKTSTAEGKRKPGGQPGRVGKNLAPFENPDEIINVPVDIKALPAGRIYKKVGYVVRQVVELLIKRHVKEYRLGIVEDENGKKYTAQAPEGTSRPVQYGASVKTMAVYMGIHQLVPCGRVEEYFRDQAAIPLSSGSLFNFNKEAFEKLEDFENIARKQLIMSDLLNVDETGINVNGKLRWLHTASSDLWTLFMPHATRGTKAMEAMGILPHFKGTLIHDHWTPYYTYKECDHGSCNAHHLRELQAVFESSSDQTWAQKMKDLLIEINEAVGKTQTNALNEKEADGYRKRYRDILAKGDVECPPPPEPSADDPKKRGKVKRSKARNLLERLRNFEDDVLRFMIVPHVPFTNNRGERDIRMTKVQQKISGCFKSFEGARIFCRIRSYLLTAQKHGMTPTDALATLFQGNLPPFCHSP